MDPTPLNLQVDSISILVGAFNITLAKLLLFHLIILLLMMFLLWNALTQQFCSELIRGEG